MVSKQEYEKRTKEYWKTVKVKTNCILRNGIIEIPKGTLCAIVRKGGGFTLQAEPCKTCGVSVLISKVPPEDVYVVS